MLGGERRGHGISGQASDIPVWLAILGCTAFVALTLLNKATYKLPMIDWALGALVVAATALVILFRLRMPRSLAALLLASVAWLLPGLVLTPIYQLSGHHMAAVLFTMALWVLTGTLVYVVLAGRFAGRAVMIAATLWVLVNLAALLAYWAGVVTYEGNAFSGLFRNRNNFAMQTICVSALVVVFCRMTWWSRAILFLATFEIFASLSISGMIGQAIVLGYSAWLDAHPRRKLAVVLLALGLALITVTVDSPMKRRIDTFAAVVKSPELVRPTSSAFYRTWLYVSGVDLWLQRPWIGHGLDTARFYLRPPTERFESSEEGFYAHSNHLEILIGLGVVGWVLHYLPLIIALGMARRTNNSYAMVKMLVVLNIVLGLTVGTYIQFATIVLYCVALLLAMSEISVDRNRHRVRHITSSSA